MEIYSLRFDGEILRILDQRYLPFEVLEIECRNAKDVFEAINEMKIRGAPAIGVAAAYGMYLGIKSFEGNSVELLARLKEVKAYLDSARPTAINLRWATERIFKVANESKVEDINGLKEVIKNEAIKIEEEDVTTNLRISEYGSTLFKDNDRIMTICNSGALATAGYGTAFGVIRRSFEKYKDISAVVLETRPYLQGARLTAFELKELGIPFKLITDNMSGYVMQKGLVSGVVVGADRIAINGDTANKVGTYMLAVLAHYHGIPFYVAAPISSIDPCVNKGSDIPIEERNIDEVTSCGGKRIAPYNIEAYNPAFDVTPEELIQAIITERGILEKPFKDSISKVCEKDQGER